MQSPTQNITPASGQSDAGAAIAAMEALHGTELLTLRGDVSVVAVPKGMEIKSIKPLLDEYLAKPERRKGIATLFDTESFIGHVNRFASDHTAIFADPNRDQPRLTAVLDYIPRGGDPAETAWMQHRAVYAPELSESWKAWLEHDNEPMDQGAFAAFIEEHLPDIIVPNFDEPAMKTFADLVKGRFAEPSELVALSRGLQINVDSVVKNAINLSSGEIAVVYEETHRDGAGQPINVPNLFQLALPVFYAGTLYRIAARLRYRRVNQSLRWSYLLVRPDLVFDDALRGIVDAVRTETEADVFLGKPEA